MDPVPYQIREEDVDEVLGAYEATGGGTFTDEDRASAREHVMRHVLELDETVRSAPESDTARETRADVPRAGTGNERPGEDSAVRREMALAAIEDLLIRDGFIEADADDRRVFPVTPVNGEGED